MTRCPICLREMSSRHPSNERRPSRDHILPLSEGGRNVPDNIRIVCARCNTLLAACGHCIGAVACVLTVDRNGFATAALWRLAALYHASKFKGIVKPYPDYVESAEAWCA